MDSLTQLVLGAAVGEATLGRKTGNKAALWGAVAGTLPDLDVFVPLGDAVKDFTYHRSASHSLLVLALATPFIVWLINRCHPQFREYRRQWVLMIYLVFLTHVLLDTMTAYGTQILWPLLDTPFSWSTIFIIDPLYTLPLLIGLLSALVMTRQHHRGHLLNRAGLILSSLYLGWTVLAKIMVETRFEADLKAQGIEYQTMFTTPTPFNSMLWRAVITDREGYYESYYSLLDGEAPLIFKHYPRGDNLLSGIEQNWAVERLKWFTRGFYGVSLQDQKIVINDLRMGVEDYYVFRFTVGELSNPHAKAVKPQALEANRDMAALRLVWQRIWNPAVIISPAKGENMAAQAMPEARNPGKKSS